MRKGTMVFLLCIIFIVNTITVFSENATITVNVKNIDKSVTVTGNISSGAGKQISICLTDPRGNIAYIDQIESGVNGIFEITFSLAENALEGLYIIKVGGTDVANPASLDFTYNKSSELTERIQFIDVDANINISGYVPSISGTVYCIEDKTVNLRITNKSNNETIVNETITSQNGVFNFSYTLPSLLNPREYEVLVSCVGDNSNLMNMSVIIDSSILALNLSGIVTTADNVDIEAQFRSVNTGLIDKNMTFAGNEDVSVRVPNILPTASFHIAAKGYETVPVSGQEPEIVKITANVENTDRNVVITGNINTGEGKQIIVDVIDDSNNVVYQGQTESVTGGNFSLQFILPETAQEGLYNVIITEATIDTPVNLSFMYTIERENYIYVTSAINSEFNVYMNIINLSGIDDETIHIINYNPEKIMPIDLCGLTYDKEIGTGVITGGITIVSYDSSSGIIEYKFNLMSGENTGTSNIIKFKALSDITDEIMIYTIQ